MAHCISGLRSRQLCDRPEKLLEKSFAVVAAAAAGLDSASCKINVFALDVCLSDLAFPQHNNLFFLCRNNSYNCHLHIECSHCKTTDWRKKLNDIRQAVQEFMLTLAVHYHFWLDMIELFWSGWTVLNCIFYFDYLHYGSNGILFIKKNNKLRYHKHGKCISKADWSNWGKHSMSHQASNNSCVIYFVLYSICLFCILSFLFKRFEKIREKLYNRNVYERTQEIKEERQSLPYWRWAKTLHSNLDSD